MEPRRRLEDWHHMLIMCLVMLVISGGLAYLFFKVDFIPQSASAQREMIDPMVKLLFGIAAIFFGVIVTVFAYAFLFFRRREGDNTDGSPIKGNALLEITWTIIPLGVVIALGIYGASLLNKMTVPPVAAEPPKAQFQVNVTAFRYGWQFYYPADNVTSFELELPVNLPVLFEIQSKDVVHSFWVQEWGPKQDAVPGLTTYLLITPTKTGDYTVRCSQLCGYGHTLMTAPAHVVSQSAFQSWIQQQQQKSKPTPTPTPTPTPSGATFQTLAAAGADVYSTNCAVCHGANGQGGVGPALWGSGATLGTYSGVTLFNNNAQDMLNFISTKMPLTAPGSLSQQQYIDVLSYILVQDNQVSPSTVFNQSQLGGITLK